MTPLNKQIIALRKKGFSFSKIAKQLKCSKSTVSYALRKKTRIKSKQKQDKLPKHKKTLSIKSIPSKNTPTPKTKQKTLVYQQNTKANK